MDIDDLHAFMKLKELLDRLILPNMLTEQDIKDWHRKIFRSKKMNPENYKAS